MLSACYDPHDHHEVVSEETDGSGREVPLGWEGIFVEFDAKDPGACPVEQTTVLVRGLKAQAAICRGCSHAASPSWCTRARLAVHANPTCSDEPYRILGEGRDGSTWTWPSDAQAVSLLPALPPATCELATHPMQEVAPVRADFRLLLCAAAAITKENQGRRCIVRPGLALCPFGWTDDIGEAAMGWRDTRSCSPCETPKLEDAQCSASLVPADRDIAGSSMHACLGAGPRWFSLALTITASPCRSRGWQARGQVEAGPQVTYCCTQDP